MRDIDGMFFEYDWADQFVVALGQMLYQRGGVGVDFCNRKRKEEGENRGFLLRII